MSGRLAHDFSTCGCRCCGILARLSSFLLGAETREEVRVAAVPLLESVYTRLLERALGATTGVPFGSPPPPGTGGEQAGGSGGGPPGTSGEGSPGVAEQLLLVVHGV